MKSYQFKTNRPSAGDYLQKPAHESTETFVEFLKNGVGEDSREPERPILSLSEAELLAEINLIETRERVVSLRESQFRESEKQRARGNVTLAEWLIRPERSIESLSLGDKVRLQRLREQLRVIQTEKRIRQLSYANLTRGNLSGFLRS